MLIMFATTEAAGAYISLVKYASQGFLSDFI